jgi:hypothetical protein
LPEEIVGAREKACEPVLNPLRRACELEHSEPLMPDRRLPDDLLDQIFPARNLAHATLRAQLGEGPVLLVLIRHFG